MPTIPYPDVPDYSGVPSIPRMTAGSPAINISLATGQGVSTGGAQEPKWGIYSATDNSPMYTPEAGETLSTFSFDYSRQTTVSTYPVEQGSFASYDKIWSPANPIVTLAFSGSESGKRNLLSILEAACLYPVLWNVYTPDAEYDGYTIERYSYRRMATKGATMLLIDVSLKEIKQVTASYSDVAAATVTPPSGNTSSSGGSAPTTPNAQSPAAATPASNGQVQPATPSQSTTRQAWTFIRRALGIIPGSD